MLDFPLRVPVPAKVAIRIMPPIDLREELGRKPDVQEGYSLVRSRMQRTVTRLANDRTPPVVG